MKSRTAIRLLLVAAAAQALVWTHAPPRRMRAATSADAGDTGDLYAPTTTSAAPPPVDAEPVFEAAPVVAAAPVVVEAAAPVEAAPVDAAAAAPPAPAPEPESYVEAESWALARCADARVAGDAEAAALYAAAGDLFEKALDLPGDDYDVRRVQRSNSPVGGAPVMRDLERVTYPSVLQKQTAHFNVACCRAKSGEDARALDALEAALALGFDDFDLVDKESDFASVRDDVDALLKKYKPKGPLAGIMAPSSTKKEGLLGALFGGGGESSDAKTGGGGGGFPNPFGGGGGDAAPKQKGGGGFPNPFGGGGDAPDKKGFDPLGGLFGAVEDLKKAADSLVDRK